MVLWQEDLLIQSVLILVPPGGRVKIGVPQLHAENSAPPRLQRNRFIERLLNLLDVARLESCRRGKRGHSTSGE